MVALATISGPVLADAVLPIGGAFGTEAGCDFFMTGQAMDDDWQLITPDTFTTQSTGCYFETLVSKRDGAYELEASCRAEGERGSFHDRVSVVDRGRDGVFVALESVGEWGPLHRCPGTEDLFGTSGIEV
jgi:hypothetical protein